MFPHNLFGQHKPTFTFCNRKRNWNLKKNPKQQKHKTTKKYKQENRQEE